MRILGIDPGLRITGYGLVDMNGAKVTLLETGTIAPVVKQSFENRIKKIYDHLEDLIKEYKPDIMVLEKLYTHTHHPTTASLLGHVRGVICLLSAQHKLKFAEQSVRRIRKAVIGRGGASKLQTRGMVAHVLRVDERKLTQDASDALALAIGYCQFALNKI